MSFVVALESVEEVPEINPVVELLNTTQQMLIAKLDTLTEKQSFLSGEAIQGLKSLMDSLELLDDELAKEEW